MADVRCLLHVASLYATIVCNMSIFILFLKGRSGKNEEVFFWTKRYIGIEDEKTGIIDSIVA